MRSVDNDDDNVDCATGVFYSCDLCGEVSERQCTSWPSCRQPETHQALARCRWAELQGLLQQLLAGPLPLLPQRQTGTQGRLAAEPLIGQTRRRRTPLPLQIVAPPLVAARPPRPAAHPLRRHHAPLPQQPAAPPLRAVLPQRCAVRLRRRRRAPLPLQIDAPPPQFVPQPRLRQRAVPQRPLVASRRLTCARLPPQSVAAADCEPLSPAPTGPLNVRKPSSRDSYRSDGVG